MKYYFKLALVGAIVLTAAACAREPLAPEETQAQAETGVKEVTTQFVLNVASAPSTKMTADVVQQNHNFRGMDNAQIFVYNTGMAPAANAYVLNTTGWTSANTKSFDIGSLLNASGISNTGTENDELSSNRVLQLSLPVGVDAVTFYGKAVKGNNAKSSEYGGTNMSGTNTKIDVNPSETVIAAQRVLDTEDDVVAYDATAALMIYVINDILDTYVDATTEVLDGFEGSTYPVDHDTEPTTYDGVGHRDLSWNALGHQYEIQTKGSLSRYSAAEGFGLGRTISGLEEVLGRCYYLFTYIKDEEYRAGSSGAVKRMVMDMYRVIKAAKDATPTNEYEANAKRLADAVLDRAELYFLTENSGDLKAGDYKANSTIQSLMASNGVMNLTEWNNRKFNKAKSLNGYPFEDFGVPRGAAQLAFHCEGESLASGDEEYDQNNDGRYDNDIFYYLHPNKALVSTTNASFEPRKYLHPAELWYYVNSPIRTTDKTDLLVGDYPNGVNKWSVDASWTDGAWASRGKVLSSTRGVAVKNNINYGVALLKSSVLLAATDGKYYDNRAAMTEETTNREILESNLKLELTAVLVGGVNPRMNWQFMRKFTTGEFSYFDGVIVDASIANATVPTPSGKENYTLVYDNYNSTGTSGEGAQTDQNDVLIALEFKNTGDAFWGKHNLIPTDGYFYLVARVPKPDATKIATLDGKWPSDHQIPPVYGVDSETVPSDKVAGESKKIARVFMQDFMTEIKFKLTENSLQNAYYSMPDLRASQMSLGLSVDLQWIPGLVYDDIVL